MSHVLDGPLRYGAFYTCHCTVTARTVIITGLPQPSDEMHVTVSGEIMRRLLPRAGPLQIK